VRRRWGARSPARGLVNGSSSRRSAPRPTDGQGLETPCFVPASDDDLDEEVQIGRDVLPFLYPLKRRVPCFYGLMVM